MLHTALTGRSFGSPRLALPAEVVSAGANLITKAVLCDGAPIEIRPLERSDRAAVATTFDGLSPMSRYLRFASPKPRLSERELDQLVDINHHSREAFVALEPRTAGGIGIARYVEMPEKPTTVEIAVAVVDQWQSQGVGSVLVARLVERARDEGYTTLRATLLSTNQRTINMLRKLGFAAVASTGLMWDYERGLYLGGNERLVA
jgi:L-amino acid N-acyltransferase YncA